ncbi:hypothetical protein AABB24_019968, partial [Solanum stoloniferum]
QRKFTTIPATRKGVKTRRYEKSSEERVTAEGSVIPCLLSPNAPLCFVRFAAARNCPISSFGMGRNLQEKGCFALMVKFFEIQILDGNSSKIFTCFPPFLVQPKSPSI